MTFLQSKTHSNKIAAITVSAIAGLAAMAAPTAAQAQSYQHNSSYAACKSADTNNQVVGGLLGAVVGGVLGSQVSGNGARTEGSVLGAVIGGAADAGIGDGKRKCRTDSGLNGYRTTTYDRGYNPAPTSYRTGGSYGSTYGGSVVTVGHPHRRTNGYDSRSYDRNYDRRDNRLDNIDYRIYETRRELERLKRRARHGDRYADHRIHEVGQKLRRLKNRRKNVKRGYRRH